MRLIITLTFVSAFTLGYYTRPTSQPFDAAHPRRLLALYLENITDSTPVFHLHLASIDPSPIEEYITKASEGLIEIGEKLEAVDEGSYQNEWEVIYRMSRSIPLSNFFNGLITFTA
jgi:hypothetical protein